MKKRIVVISLLFFIFFTICLYAMNKLNNKKDSSFKINDGHTEKFFDEESDEIIDVSLKTHKKLFSSLKNYKEWDKRKPGSSNIDIEVAYKDENNKNFIKIYDINDTQLRDDFMLYNISSISYGMAGYEKEGVEILFDNTLIENKYKLIIPDEYNSKKVRSVNFVNNENDMNLIEIQYPDSCVIIRIDGCNNLKKIAFGDEATFVYVNNCNNLIDISNITSENCIRIGNSFNNISVCKITVPDSVILISYSYCDLGQVTEINISKNIKIIMNSFNNCPNIKKIDIPDNISSIWDSFKDCDDLTLIVGAGTVGEKYAIDNNIKYEYRK